MAAGRLRTQEFFKTPVLVISRIRCLVIPPDTVTWAPESLPPLSTENSETRNCLFRLMISGHQGWIETLPSLIRAVDQHSAGNGASMRFPYLAAFASVMEIGGKSARTRWTSMNEVAQNESCFPWVCRSAIVYLRLDNVLEKSPVSAASLVPKH